jgi:SAM-dependent methyltransferase
MSKRAAEILKPVNYFFSDALARYGAAHRATDWPDPHQQIRRFAELSRLFDLSRPFDLLDYGCGYGALLDYLTSRGSPVAYWGYDISHAMLAAARDNHKGMEDKFLAKLDKQTRYDYVVASGIFNRKMDIPLEEWDDIVRKTIEEFNALSSRGFAFNMLTAYRDPQRKQPHLYYGDPLHWFDLCFRKYSPNISLAHDYDLWDFTIIVRK